MVAVLLLYPTYGETSLTCVTRMRSAVSSEHGMCRFFDSVCEACSCMLTISGSVVSYLVTIIILWSICHLVQVLLGEEVATSKLTLFDVTKQLCDAIQARGEQGEKCHAFCNITVVFWLF